VTGRQALVHVIVWLWLAVALFGLYVVGNRQRQDHTQIIIRDSSGRIITPSPPRAVQAPASVGNKESHSHSGGS
jgi:hypothetical protein